MSKIELTIYDCGKPVKLDIIFPQGPKGDPGGGGSFTKMEFSESDLVEESWGGAWFLPVDLSDKDFVSAKVEQDGNTEYKSVDNLSKMVGWPLHRLSGFANNSTQKITITLSKI